MNPIETSIHVVALRMVTRVHATCFLVRVPKSPPGPANLEAHDALALAMKEIPSASEGRYVGPANQAQIDSVNAPHNLNRNVIPIN